MRWLLAILLLVVCPAASASCYGSARQVAVALNVESGSQFEIEPGIEIYGSCDWWPPIAADGDTVTWPSEGGWTAQTLTRRDTLHSQRADTSGVVAYGRAEGAWGGDLSMADGIVYSMSFPGSHVQWWNTQEGTEGSVPWPFPRGNGSASLGGHVLYWLSWDEIPRLSAFDLAANMTLLESVSVLELGFPRGVRAYAQVGVNELGYSGDGGLQNGVLLMTSDPGGSNLTLWKWQTSSRVATPLGTYPDWIADGGDRLYIGNATATRIVFPGKPDQLLPAVEGTVLAATGPWLIVGVELARAMPGLDLKANVPADSQEPSTSPIENEPAPPVGFVAVGLAILLAARRSGRARR